MTEAQTRDGGDAILEAFRNLGIDYIISSPGSEWAPVWEALARQKINESEGPTYINCWHETLAVDMALGYTRVTGKMQAVLLHAGVGLLQGGVGIHSAFLGEVPMVVCSGEAISYGENPDLDPQGQWYRNLSVVGGPNRFVEPFVKWSGQATSPYTLYEQLVRAGEMAQRVPKGPTFLDIPIETMIHDWAPPAKIRRVADAPKIRPTADSIDRLASLIANSSRPLMIAEGSGQEIAGFENLVKLAELMAIPVTESASIHANFPKSHPLYLGTPEAYLDQADLVLLLGSRSPWYPPNAGPANATVVALGENPLKGQMAYQNLLADMYVEGDMNDHDAAAGGSAGSQRRHHRRPRYENCRAPPALDGGTRPINRQPTGGRGNRPDPPTHRPGLVVRRHQRGHAGQCRLCRGGNLPPGTGNAPRPVGPAPELLPSQRRAGTGPWAGPGR